MKGKPWKKGLSVLTAVLMLFCAVLPVFPELADRVEVTAAAASDSTRNITYILKGTFGDKEYHKMIVQSHTAGSKVKLYGMKETFANYCYGYEFKGWKAPSGTMYAAGQEVAWIDDVRLNAVLEPLPRTITYKANGGTGADIVTQRLAGEATVLEPYDIFTRTGYFHYSWNTKPDGSGTNYFPGWTVKWTGNVTLYAKWVSEDDETIQTITYKSNGAGADDVVQKSIRRTSPDSTYVTYRQVLYPADTFTRYGYTFTGWNTRADGSGNSYRAGQEVSWQEKVTLYAQWAANRKITYKANGGSGSDIVQWYSAGVEVSLNNANIFTRSGYTFAGWNSKADGSGNTYGPEQSVKWQTNATLYAQWVEGDQKMIVFYPNGGNGGTVIQMYRQNETVTLRSDLFTRTNWYFSCWATTPNAGYRPYYYAGDAFSNGNKIQCLYAIWHPRRSITYKANGAAGEDIVQWHGQSMEATLKPADTFTRTGYTFIGWCNTANGSGTTYPAGQKVYWNDNATLYARWKANDNVTITFKPNGRSGQDYIIEHQKGESVTLASKNIFTREGYTFTGWNSKADGSGNHYNAGQSVAWRNNVTLYAEWVRNSTITYEANGGKGKYYATSYKQTQIQGAEAVLYPADTFKRTGYTFIGWNSEADGSGNSYEPGQVVSWWDNVTLYAQWRQFKQIIYYPGWEWEWGKSFYDIKYDGEDFIIQAQDCIAREDVPTRTGYTFVGWKTQDDGTGKSYQPGQIVSWNDDVPRFLYAQWVENRRITYIANDGTDSSVEQYHGQGLKAALKPADTFTREGYTFAGWNSKADGSGNTYAAGQEVSWINNVTLYAKWTKC